MDYLSKKEKLLYPPICLWLKSYLTNKFRHAQVQVYDVHSRNLSDLLEGLPQKKYFPEYATYQIKVDIVATVEINDKCELVFVEVKDTTLSLKDLSQLIGYSKIVMPIGSFLLSPKPMAKPLHTLLNHFNRLDILEYSPDHFVRIGKWDLDRQSVLSGNLMPPYNYSAQTI